MERPVPIPRHPPVSTPATPAQPTPRRRWSVRVATVAGIDIRVHATFVVLVALVVVGSTGPDSPGLLSSLAWLVALFACVVLHELAHSLVARGNGIPIVEIELLPIGGISKMERSPEDPRVELRIAAAGPAASIAIAVVLGATAAVSGASLWPPEPYTGAFLSRLAWVNLLLAGFNLLPALPLDGGRVLRARLEERRGRERATRVAARISRALAVAMMAAGFAVSIWLLLIGMFVYAGSWAEETSAIVHERLKGLRVSDAMVHDPAVVAAETRAGDIAARLWHSSQREFPVLDAGRPIGVVTADAILRASPGTPVGALAVAAPCVGPEEPLEASGVVDGEHDIAVVVDDDRVVGIVRADDVALVAQRLLHGNPTSAG